MKRWCKDCVTSGLQAADKTFRSQWWRRATAHERALRRTRGDVHRRWFYPPKGRVGLAGPELRSSQTTSAFWGIPLPGAGCLYVAHRRCRGGPGPRRKHSSGVGPGRRAVCQGAGIQILTISRVRRRAKVSLSADCKVCVELQTTTASDADHICVGWFGITCKACIHAAGQAVIDQVSVAYIRVPILQSWKSGLRRKLGSKST